MAVLGVIILIVVAVVSVTVVSTGGDPVALELPGFDIDTTAAGVFGVGAGSLLLGVLGVVLMLGGARRGQRRRKEVKRLRRDADHQLQDAGDEPVPPGRSEPVDDPGTRRPSDRGDRGGGDRRTGGRGRGRRDEGHGDHFSSVPRD